MMEHKGYIGRVEFDAEAGLFHGEVINTRDVISCSRAQVECLIKKYGPLQEGGWRPLSESLKKREDKTYNVWHVILSTGKSDSPYFDISALSQD